MNDEIFNVKLSYSKIKSNISLSAMYKNYIFKSN